MPEEEPFFEEVRGDDPIVLALEERLRTQNGNPALTLDMTLNPGTIVNTERDIILLRAELKATPEGEAEKIKELEDKIEKKQMKVVNEMRQVMTDNLKLEFIIQAVLSIPLFIVLAFNKFPFLPDWSWLEMSPMATELTFKLFGMWGIWLVTIPALRARKPGGPYGMGYEEKRALDLGFLTTPIICFLGPVFTKEAGYVFLATLALLIGLYVWSFNTPLQDESRARRGAANDADLPEVVRWALRALDFGTGSERGPTTAEDTSWQAQLDAYEREAEILAEKKRQEQQEKAKTADGKAEQVKA